MRKTTIIKTTVTRQKSWLRRAIKFLIASAIAAVSFGLLLHFVLNENDLWRAIASGIVGLFALDVAQGKSLRNL